jgi:hypothetical protein
MRTYDVSARTLIARRAAGMALVILVAFASQAEALEIMQLKLPSLHLGRRHTRTTVANLDWYTSYAAACEAARCEKKLLVVNFLPTGKNAAQRDFEKYLEENPAVREKLDGFVLARIPIDARMGIGRNARKLIDDPAFKHQHRRAGFVILDFQHEGKPYYGRVVSVLPYSSGKYYRWENSNLAVALDLPAGTITQRMMVWAVRTHPERPQSTVGTQSTALAEAAAKQSAYQASVGVQGHQNWETRFHQVRAVTNAASANEVVAESWPNQDLIDSCIDCVKSWRHSSGHWGAVRKRHRLYGYDIRLGNNGIWYGTGIFAN